MSARRGAPIVVLRAAEQSAMLEVQIPDVCGPSWERALSAACALVVDAAERNTPVRLVLADARLPALMHDALLAQLALAERRP